MIVHEAMVDLWSTTVDPLKPTWRAACPVQKKQEDHRGEKETGRRGRRRC